MGDHRCFNSNKAYMNTALTVGTVVVPVAGYGTRSLPFTKALPKVMLPLVDKPGVQCIVEEAVKSGIGQVVFVTSANQHSIEDHFDYYYELEEKLRQSGKIELLKEIRRVSDLAHFVYVRQKEQLGNAHAILEAKSIVGNQPFCVQWGDGVLTTTEGETPLLKRLINIYQTSPDCDAVLAVHETDDAGTNKYAIVETETVGIHTKITAITEKPGPDQTSSRLASNVAYLLTPKIFDYIERLDPAKGVGGEYVLADAIKAMIADGKNIYAAKIPRLPVDLGNKLEYAKGFVQSALTHPEIKDEFAKYLHNLLQ